jgi:hypothetical protein
LSNGGIVGTGGFGGDGSTTPGNGGDFSGSGGAGNRGVGTPTGIGLGGSGKPFGQDGANGF